MLTKAEVGAVLRRCREESGLTQKEAAAKLGKKQQTIASWERGQSQPDAQTLFDVCDIYGTTVSAAFGVVAGIAEHYTPDEKETILKYRKLDQQGQTEVKHAVDRELSRTERERAQNVRIAALEAAQVEEEMSNIIDYQYFGKIACAGSAFTFDDLPTSTIRAPYMPHADFIIGVNGLSMEPTYFDGDKLYVEKTENFKYGDICIFTQGNDCYVKEYGKEGLISHNPKSRNIPAAEDIRYIGKVLGKVEES